MYELRKGSMMMLTPSKKDVEMYKNAGWLLITERSKTNKSRNKKQKNKQENQSLEEVTLPIGREEESIG